MESHPLNFGAVAGFPKRLADLISHSQKQNICPSGNNINLSVLSGLGFPKRYSAEANFFGWPWRPAQN